jgi:hypothetical protein
MGRRWLGWRRAGVTRVEGQAVQATRRLRPNGASLCWEHGGSGRWDGSGDVGAGVSWDGDEEWWHRWWFVAEKGRFLPATRRGRWSSPRRNGRAPRRRSPPNHAACLLRLAAEAQLAVSHFWRETRHGWLGGRNAATHSLPLGGEAAARRDWRDGKRPAGNGNERGGARWPHSLGGPE